MEGFFASRDPSGSAAEPCVGAINTPKTSVGGGRVRHLGVWRTGEEPSRLDGRGEGKRGMRILPFDDVRGLHCRAA